MSIYTQKLNYEEKNTHLKAHRQKKRHWVILILTIFSFFLCVNLISAAGGNWTGKTTPGLIFWSQFENSTGTVLFNEVLGIKNGIINPPGTGVVWNSSGKYNRGISMERITSGGCLYNLSDGTTYSFDDNGENFTIEAWVKTSTDDATRQPILYASSKFTFEIKNGKMYAYDPVAVADRVGDTDFVDGDWHHVAFVYNQDNNTGVFYLDGQRDGAFVYDTTAGNSLVWFGDTSPLAETGFVGTIDDLKVFN
ncbi:MAG TPA: LamG domain-containing protein, partial [Candidatus Paceibacterota bacterium]|nr:LamG domain-containing protein [Candidatus Paceibacterota bacterium]